MHPRFFEYLNLVREEQRKGSFEIMPFMVTNGKTFGKAMKLLDILEEEWENESQTISVNLSRDEWHDSIDPRVVNRYARMRGRGKDRLIEFRSVTRIAPVGRGRHKRFDGMRTITPCACETPLVDPEGMVWSCGCKTHLLGSIWDENVFDGYREEFAHEGGKEP